MKTLTVLSLVTAAIFLGACKSTPKPEFTNVPGSFQTTKIQNDLFGIDYVGEVAMSESQAKQYAGQRVSTLCLNEGFEYFLVLNSENTWVDRPAAPGFAPEHPASQPHKVPTVAATVRMFKKEPNIPNAAVYNAKQVETNLRAAF